MGVVADTAGDDVTHDCLLSCTNNRWTTTACLHQAGCIDSPNDNKILHRLGRTIPCRWLRPSDSTQTHWSTILTSYEHHDGPMLRITDHRVPRITDHRGLFIQPQNISLHSHPLVSADSSRHSECSHMLGCYYSLCGWHSLKV